LYTFFLFFFRPGGFLNLSPLGFAAFVAKRRKNASKPFSARLCRFRSGAEKEPLLRSIEPKVIDRSSAVTQSVEHELAKEITQLCCLTRPQGFTRAKGALHAALLPYTPAALSPQTYYLSRE
jgi:hypothetical protein